MSASEIKTWLEARKRIREKATPGPWHISTLGEACYGDANDMRESFSVHDTSEDNEPFFVDARNSQEKFEALVEVLLGAVEEICTAAPRDDEHETAHISNYWRLKASFNCANRALTRAAEILGERK